MWYVRPGKDQPAYARTSDQSLCNSYEYSMTVQLQTEQHLEFLSLKGGCTGSSDSIHVKMATLLEISCLNMYITVVHVYYLQKLQS